MEGLTEDRLLAEFPEFRSADHRTPCARCHHAHKHRPSCDCLCPGFVEPGARETAVVEEMAEARAIVEARRARDRIEKARRKARQALEAFRFRRAA